MTPLLHPSPAPSSHPSFQPLAPPASSPFRPSALPASSTSTFVFVSSTVQMPGPGSCQQSPPGSAAGRS